MMIQLSVRQEFIYTGNNHHVVVTGNTDTDADETDLRQEGTYKSKMLFIR